MIAEKEGYTIFTHDLDFGAILSATNATSPSVIQLRDEDIFPCKENIDLFVGVMNQLRQEWEYGCIITINKQKAKVRLLPIYKHESSRILFNCE
jgi:predicted nuclease of predicted toxin-antitoxin system